VAFRCLRDMVIYVIEVTELNFDIRSGIQGFLEVALALEVTKMAVKVNMHTRVI